MADVPAFQQWRLDAVREFAQTMIVIDDQASQSQQTVEASPVGRLNPPNRATSATPRSGEPVVAGQTTAATREHSLNAKVLIDEAMDLGLICSVLRPGENENFKSRVVKAAKHADIVCLDWEIYEDGGDAAAEIISKIIQDDATQNGRLRLIAIYTGDKTNIKILDKIFKTIPQKLRNIHQLKKGTLALVSQRGLKIVCLFKTHGIQLPEASKGNQVSEKDLPKRLQSEFASLSEGLLSNVALGTIAAIRNSTHHVLSKFVGAMDGPYFHHRASIATPEDAEEYAVDIVFSALKSVIDKRGIATRNAGAEAIRARVNEFANGTPTLTLHYLNSGGPTTHEVQETLVSQMIIDGIKPIRTSISLTNLPSSKIFAGEFTTLFAPDLDEAHSMMHQFAALTEVRAHPQNHVFKTGDRLPTLGLGAVVERMEGRRKQKIYLLCLQASCDSVGIKNSCGFFFVPLEGRQKNPEHVVPKPDHRSKEDWIGLAVAKAAYTMVSAIEFAACSVTKTVVAKRIKRKTGWYFEDTAGNTYRWIADLKRRRALRAAQRLGQQVGRLGFDEFEPYRRNSNE